MKLKETIKEVIEENILKESPPRYNVFGDAEEKMDPKKMKSVSAEIKNKALKICDAKIAQFESKIKSLKSMKEDIQGAKPQDFKNVGWLEASDIPSASIVDVSPDFKIKFSDGLTSFTIRFIDTQKKTVFRSGGF